MKKTIFILAMIGLLLAGCGATAEPVDTPTLAPTDTPNPPTATPEPTATLEPTAMPTPTPEPTMISISDLMEEIVEELDAEHSAAVMNAEYTEFEGGYYRWAIGLNNSLLDRWEWVSDYPFTYINRAGAYSRIGDFESAIQDLETAAQLPYMDQFERAAADMKSAAEYYTEEELNDISAMYNNLCWYLAITNQPERALPYCEQAVALFPSAAITDSLAMVHAMLGRTEEAVAGFEEFFALAEDDPSLPADLVDERKLWVAALNNGENPFTEITLEALQRESIDPYAYPEPEMLEDYSLQHFTQILSQDGFVLVDSGTNDNGTQYEMYGLKFGTCYNYVLLFFTEDNVGMARILLAGCDEEQYIAEMRWFAKLLLMNNPREDMDCIAMGEWFSWELTDLRELVNGEIDQMVRFSVRGVTFESERDENPDMGTTIIITGR